MPTNMKESGFEEYIVDALVAHGGYVKGLASDFVPEHALDVNKLMSFLERTQSKKVEQLGIASNGSSRNKFLYRLRQQITRRGVLDVLLGGVSDGPVNLTLFYRTPSAKNQRAIENFDKNIFSVTRQVRFSLDNPKQSVDLVIFVNGLPVATMELKNQVTHQNYNDAIAQYKRDRDPKELLFEPGRCAVHLAMDESQAYFCTKLAGKQSWFLPFNRGYNDGAGNPANPDGFSTAYVWEEVFERGSLVDIIENFAKRVDEKDPRTKKKSTKFIWPRYHQLRAVRSLLDHAKRHGAGQRYLIQHSAGSGKSYSITWLAHQLISVMADESEPLFHTVFVITDRRVLDTQIRNEIKRFTKVKSVVGAVTERSSQLREFIQQGKRVITSTIQKFPFILDELGNAHRDKRFAIIIDEAHSSQGGKSAAAVNRALENATSKDDVLEDAEDRLNQMIQSRKMLGNASYFAFTATPKNKTEELFGTQRADGSFGPFHSYTMKQAIQEGFIKDVLAHYTTVDSYYALVKETDDDPEYDAKKAQAKLRRYVEGHSKPLRAKAEVMLEHFVNKVWKPNLVGGKARAMLVTDGVNRVLEYKAIFDELLEAQDLPFKVVVAFSGERDWHGKKVTEDNVNGFPSAEIPAKLKKDPYRILIVADKFQTGFDEPLLQTMYVDKALSDVKAVQTLSRLNRAHPKKPDVYVMDFANTVEGIKASFEKYYRATILSESTDVNKLHDLKAELDNHRVYDQADVDTLVELFLDESDRAKIEAIIDDCVKIYTDELDEDDQVSFKGSARGFVRLYNFMSAIITFSNTAWEKLSIFLNFLIPRLPAPREEDYTKSLLENIDLDSYRNAIKEKQAITLADEEGELAPVPMVGARSQQELELDTLSNIIQQFNDTFGGLFDDPDFAVDIITQQIPAIVAQDPGVQNAVKQGDRQKIELEIREVAREALFDVTLQQATRTDDAGRLLRAFSDDEQHQRFILETVHRMVASTAYEQAVAVHSGWDELIDLLDEPWPALGRALAELGVPAPVDVDFEIKGCPGERCLMVWATPDRGLLGVVPAAVTGEPQEIDLLNIGAEPDAAEVASTLNKLLGAAIS